ncbi:hypothetical protein Vadar_012840 [Vaccinium darrowii]|uniref:Uncharacterized protein n=1 Tax=Vaccinium darrowii TaxID=229202 RepID=A0ACB7XYL4_9ERIC|nr:hypothetical protein Vadar_012840 [Vaccinium darrowii]
MAFTANDVETEEQARKRIEEQWNILQDDERWKYLAMADDCVKPKKNYVQARISLRSIVKIIRRLSLDQIAAVNEIGLGGLLALKCTKLDHNLSQWLVQNFDPESSSMNVHGEQLFLTQVEVHHVLGIQCEGKEVELKGSSEGFLDLRKTLKLGEGSICLKGLKVSLMKTESAGDDFKMKFALYMLGAFLCPTTKPALKKSFLHAVWNVETMKYSNWAKLTLDFLISGVRKCKRKGNPKANGCLLLLVVDMKFPSFEKQSQAPLKDTNFQEQNQESPRTKVVEELKLASPNNTVFVEHKQPETVEPEVAEFKKHFKQYHFDDNRMTKFEKELDEMKMLFMKNGCDGNRMAKMETEVVGIKSLLSQLLDRFPVKEEPKVSPNNLAPKEMPDDVISSDTDESSLPSEPVEVAQGLKRTRTFGTTDLKKISAAVDIDPIVSGKKPHIKMATKQIQRRHLRVSESDSISQIDNGRRRTRPPNELKHSQYLSSPYIALDFGKKRMKGNKKTAATKKVNLESESELDSDDVKCQKMDKALDSFLALANGPSIAKKSRPLPKPIPPRSLTSDDKVLVAYCFDEDLDHSETIVSFGMEHATRNDLFSLKPGVWIDGGIINVVAVRLTTMQRMRHPDKCWTAWYLPTYISIRALHLMLQTIYGHFYVANVTKFDWITLEDPPIQDNTYR